jgi:D-glycero-alpha-D-manno-heptose-7-phosphate kinase
MIISRTPFRISFFGGGTDYPIWYRQHGGTVLAATINKYCYLSCRYLPPFFESRIRVVWSKIENRQTIDEIEHPAVRELLRYMGIDRGVAIHHDGDLPARSGMGSSSAFTVGLMNALYALKGQMPSKHQLAMESIYIEQEVLKETVGSQDQVTTAYGGLNHVMFLENGEIAVRPLTLSSQRIKDLDAHLMLFYTGIKRTAATVADSYVQDLDTKRRQLRIMKDLVDEGIHVLTNGQDLKVFGELLNESWQLKRSLSNLVSNSEVDDLYTLARNAGAIGGKLTGAGGGGFLLLVVSPEDQPQVREALHQLLHVPFQFEFSGSQIIFYDPEQDYAQEDLDRRNQPLPIFRELSGAKSEASS